MYIRTPLTTISSWLSHRPHSATLMLFAGFDIARAHLERDGRLNRKMLNIHARLHLPLHALLHVAGGLGWEPYSCCYTDDVQSTHSMW